jgi:hypothetical protein
MNGPSKAAGNFGLLINISAKYFRHLNGCGRSLGVTDNGVNVSRSLSLFTNVEDLFNRTSMTLTRADRRG